MPSSVYPPADQKSERPPWGLLTPPAKQEYGTSNAAFMTTYDRTFKGWKGSPAKQTRHRTAQHFPSGMWRDHSNYQETFRTPVMYSRHGIIPASVNRHHKPHPSQLMWPLEPNKSYMIWKPASDQTAPRAIGSAPPSILQYDRHRQMNTTYKDFFKGFQTLDLLRTIPQPNGQRTRPMSEENRNVPMTASNGQGRRPATEGERNAPRPATIDDVGNSMYKHAFKGDFARPSTIEKAPDRSWANIRYWSIFKISIWIIWERFLFSNYSAILTALKKWTVWTIKHKPLNNIPK